VHLTTDGFTEQGGDAALTSQSDSTSSTFSTLGLRAATPFSLGGVGLTASGTIGWRHAYGSVTPSSTLSFGGGDSFTVDGVPIARNLAVLGAGISTPVSPDVTFGINYSGQVGGGTVDQGISGNLDWRF
jgi:outer membrane autotransporter protein